MFYPTAHALVAHQRFRHVLSMTEQQARAVAERLGVAVDAESASDGDGGDDHSDGDDWLGRARRACIYY